MNSTEEQLKEVETLAGLFFHPADIMTILGIPFDEYHDFIALLEIQKDSPIYKAYHKGRLTALVELQQAIKQSALNGSNPAQEKLLEDYKKSRL